MAQTTVQRQPRFSLGALHGSKEFHHDLHIDTDTGTDTVPCVLVPGNKTLNLDFSSPH